MVCASEDSGPVMACCSLPETISASAKRQRRAKQGLR